MARSLLRRFARSENGSVILETALVLTILLLLMFGVFDVGRALYTANGLISAAREGARFAAVDANVATDVTPTKNVVIARFSPFGGSALTAAQITVTPVYNGGSCAAPSSGGLPQSICVTAAYPFTWITPIPRLLGWSSNTRTITGKAEYRYEF